LINFGNTDLTYQAKMQVIQRKRNKLAEKGIIIEYCLFPRGGFVIKVYAKI